MYHKLNQLWELKGHHVFFSVCLLAEKNNVIRKGGRKVIRRKLLVLRFSEVAGRINL